MGSEGFSFRHCHQTGRLTVKNGWPFDRTVFWDTVLAEGGKVHGNVVYDAMIGLTVGARFPWRGWWAQCTSTTFFASVAILRRREGLCFMIGGPLLPQKTTHVLVDLVGVASDEMVISNVYFAVDRDS